MERSVLQPQHPDSRLDVARGVSALVVLGGHVSQIFFWRLEGPNGSLAVISGALARHAVLIFFLLSGHLITRSILGNIRQNQRFVIFNYASARIARIYPPFIGAILVCLAVVGLVHTFHLPGAVAYGIPGDLYRARDSLTMSPREILSALQMSGGLLEADGPLWSLYIECQIYVLVMAIASLWQPDRIAKLVCGALALYALYLLRDSLFFVLVWGLGAATAFWRIPRRVALGVAAMCATAALLLAAPQPNLFGADMDMTAGQAVQMLCSVGYAAILFFAYPAIIYPRRLIATANFSYSLYVVHFPLLLLTLSLSQNWIGHSLARTLGVTAISLVAIFAFVIPFAALLEQHDLVKRKIVAAIPVPMRMSGSRALSTLALIMLCILGAAKVYRHKISCQPVQSNIFGWICPRISTGCLAARSRS